MNDRIEVRVARAADAPGIEQFARRRVKWLAERSVIADWAGIIDSQATKTAGDGWRVFLAIRDDTPVGRVITWIEPPTDPKNGDRTPRTGVLGLTGLCTDPDVPDAAAELATWSARYAGVLGLSRVRIPTTIARLRDYYPALGFELGSEIDMGKNRTLWEFYRRAR